MIVFPASKINLGLNVIERRRDCFHNIETVFYPLNWRDALEVLEDKEGRGFELETSGLVINAGKTEENIIYKAWQLLHKNYKIPSLKVYLHKAIPMGAGLGGGSADAAFFLKLTDQKFGLNISGEEMMKMAAQLGSDCVFFIKNGPVFAQGKGDEIESLDLDLSKYHILVVHPGINSNTKEAYEGIVPQKPLRSVRDIVNNESVDKWKEFLINDFEKSVFKKYPEIATLKQKLYDAGAVYAAMSGSGSACYGIFEKEPDMSFTGKYLSYLQKAM